MRQLLSLALAGGLVLPVLAQPRTTFLGKPVDAWQKELRSPNPMARRDAAFALGKLGSYGADGVDDLIQLVKKDQDKRVREAAAFALGEICKESLRAAGHADLLPALKGALKDKEPLVRRSAAFALGSLGTDGAAAARDVEAALDDPDPAVRQNAAWALGRLGQDTVQALRKALRDKDARVRRDAASAVGQLNEKGRPALPELLDCCLHPDTEVKKFALATLVRLVNREDARVAAELKPVLNDPDLEVRSNAALALGNIGGDAAREAVPVLIDALKQGHTELRRQAAVAIRNIGPAARDAVPSLRRALQDQDEQLREYAAAALAGIGKEAEPAVPDLVEVLTKRSEKQEVRIQAATALAKVGSTDATIKTIPQLIEVVGDRNSPSKVRERVFWALRTHANHLNNYPTLFPTLTRILQEPKEKVGKMLRYDSAFMLGVFQKDKAPPEALDGLYDFLKDPGILIYKETIGVLGAGTEGSSGTAEVTEKGEGDGRIMAVIALQNIGRARVQADARIIPQLQAILRENPLDPDLKKRVEKALGDFK